MFKNNRIRRQVANSKTHPPPFRADVINVWSQRLHITLLFLFLLSNSFVTVIINRNETKGNINKKNQVKQKKKQSEMNWIKLKKTKIHLKQVLNQCDAK